MGQPGFKCNRFIKSIRLHRLVGRLSGLERRLQWRRRASPSGRASQCGAGPPTGAATATSTASVTGCSGSRHRSSCPNRRELSHSSPLRSPPRECVSSPAARSPEGEHGLGEDRRRAARRASTCELGQPTKQFESSSASRLSRTESRSGGLRLARLADGVADPHSAAHVAAAQRSFVHPTSSTGTSGECKRLGRVGAPMAQQVSRARILAERLAQSRPLARVGTPARQARPGRGGGRHLFGGYPRWHEPCTTRVMVQHSRAGALIGLVGLLASLAGCSGGIVDADGCNYAGKRHAVGDSFLGQDGCNQCLCSEGGQVSCTLKDCAPDTGCDYRGDHYEAGAAFPSEDGCNQCTCQSDGGVACTTKVCEATCDSIEAARAKELAKVQSCSTADECGQPISGSSCGCTRDLVARKDADLGRYLELQKSAATVCGSGGSTCDCPAADGFACVDQRCAWNYTTTEPEPDPVCQKLGGSRLCVRGTPTADGEVLSEGDVLSVTVRVDGCFSSSCTEVHTAECAITAGDGFDVAASFCVADTSASGQGCTADCGNVHADCSFGQGLSAGEHQVRLGSVVVGFQVPTKLPHGGLCAGPF
jgi:hypothetical protein